MDVGCVIATYGSDDWKDLVYSRAYPSTIGQKFEQVEIVHLRAGTLAEVRNEGAARCDGVDLLVFLDADDELATGYLDAMREATLTYTGPPPLLVPAVSWFRPPTPPTVPVIPQQGRWPELNECVIGTGVPARPFRDVGGFRDLPSLEDYDLFLRLYDAGSPLVYVPEAVYRAHLTLGSRNSDQSVYPEIWAAHLARVQEGGSR